MNETNRIADFTQLETWRMARKLRALTFRLTKQPKFDEDRGLRSQMRSAATSVMSNVGEGFEREGNKQFLQFLWIAKGSAGELRSQAYAALDSELLTESEFKFLHTTVLSASRLLAGFIRYLKTSDLRGSKYSDQADPQSRSIRENARTYEASNDEETALRQTAEGVSILRECGF